MKPIERGEILDLPAYEAIRAQFRARVIEDKRNRRVALGDHLSAVFENRDTVMLQIQEMLRTERITRESAVLHEIETYNELLPGPLQLSMTLFVEVPDREVRERLLQELAGLDQAVWLEVDGDRFAARGKRQDARDDRTTAVHYLKIDLSEAAAGAIRSGRAKVAVAVDHPRYRARTEIGAAGLVQLAGDLE